MSKLVDQFNNTYHGSIDKQSPINANYSALTKDIESSHMGPKLEGGDKVSNN